MKQGYQSKQAVKEALFELSKIPKSRFPEREVFLLVPLAERSLDGDFVRVARRAEDILVVVAGGPEPYHVCYCPNFADTTPVTKRVVSPTSKP